MNDRTKSTWYPVWSAWRPRQLDLLDRIDRGLSELGIETRRDELGHGELSLSLLRVRTPHDQMEASEAWLFQLVQPFNDREVEHDEDMHWGTALWCILHQRWPTVLLWTGNAERRREVESALRSLVGTSPRAFVGARYQVGGHGIEAFPRSAVEVAAALPRTTVSPDIEPHDWVALKSGDDAEFQDLAQATVTLEHTGVDTLLIEIPDSEPRRWLLAARAGSGDIGPFTERIRATAGLGIRSAIVMPEIFIHRCRSGDVRLIARVLQRELDGHLATHFWHPEHEFGGRIEVPVSLVERSLEVLRELPDELRGGA